MESAVSFAPLRPAGFVNFTGQGGAGRGSLFFRGAGRGGAGRPSLVMSCPDIRLHFVFLVSDRIRTQTILFNAILMNDKWSITSSKQSTFGHLVVHILRMVSHNGH